ncbi:hypothetical protein P5V15_011331 [Pogonomyrmex californicus]
MAHSRKFHVCALLWNLRTCFCMLAFPAGVSVVPAIPRFENDREDKIRRHGSVSGVKINRKHCRVTLRESSRFEHLKLSNLNNG